MTGMSDPTPKNFSSKEHAVMLAEFLAKHIHAMGLDLYETQTQHYGWKWKVSVTRLERAV